MHFFGRVPRRITTVGDLAREAAGCSFADLQRERDGFGPTDAWNALAAILREMSCHTGDINRDTGFFAQHGQSAT